jgi:hypothetical protein
LTDVAEASASTGVNPDSTSNRSSSSRLSAGANTIMPRGTFTNDKGPVSAFNASTLLAPTLSLRATDLGPFHVWHRDVRAVRTAIGLAGDERRALHRVLQQRHEPAIGMQLTDRNRTAFATLNSVPAG